MQSTPSRRCCKSSIRGWDSFAPPTMWWVFYSFLPKLCKIDIKRTLDATFLNWLALTFYGVKYDFGLFHPPGSTFLLTSNLADIHVSKVRKVCVKIKMESSFSQFSHIFTFKRDNQSDIFIEIFYGKKRKSLFLPTINSFPSPAWNEIFSCLNILYFDHISDKQILS